MKIIQPSRLTFWRFNFAVSAALSFLTAMQVINMAPEYGVDISASKSWMALIVGFGMIGAIPLLFLTLTWSRYSDHILSVAEFPEHLPEKIRWISVLPLITSIFGYTFVFRLPYLGYLNGVGWFHVLLFWYFSLLGLFALKSMRRDIPWFTALISVALCQSVAHLLLFYWNRVTDYPFAMGWSETSRYYYPSLFLSEKVYGQQYPWPILHPTLHLLLAAPYWFNAPLWVHRFWQVAIRYILVGAIVPPLLKRLSIHERATRWLVAIWMYLFLFMGPVYFHIAIPIIILLLGFSRQNDRRTWVAVILASIWCGWSRVNWYPMAGMIAAVLYLLETPFKGRNVWSYLIKPALWFVVGTLTAFASQRVYIAISGVPDSGLFYTSLASDILWYRLLPNASYFLGILPAAILASLPAWIGMYIMLRATKDDWHPLRLFFILAALFVLFIGGLIVSLKIGGGANLHNMDVYISMLLIVLAYMVFARYRREGDGDFGRQVGLHWLLVIALIIMPAWSYLQFGVGYYKNYDPAKTQKTLASLQEHVDQANAQGGEVLFITQRQLISMHMLHNVKLVPEYEREDLMELAMSNNLHYLGQFQSDMENQRFALIVVDPLNFNIMTRDRSFAEENNVWVRKIVKQILCNYREEAVFPQDDIALYVPQTGKRHCP